MGLENYNVGDYQTMSVSEKIEFLHKVHQDEISLWDDDGNDNEIWNDYHTVQDDFLEHAESLDSENILQIMRIFDDDCFELSWQLNLAKIVARYCTDRSRITYYLQHMTEIPSGGRFHGCYFVIRFFLMDEECFPIFKDALQGQTAETQKLVLQVLDKFEDCQAEVEEIRGMCGDNVI